MNYGCKQYEYINKEKKYFIEEQEKQLFVIMLRYVYLYYFVFENLRNCSVRYGKEIIGDNFC